MMTHTPWPRRPIGAILLSGQQELFCPCWNPSLMVFNEELPWSRAIAK